MADYIWLIPAFPAVGFLVNGFLGRKLPKAVISWIACLAIFASFVVSALVFVQFLKLPPEARLFEKDVYNWIASGEFSAHVGYRIDSLSIVMCLVVSGVGFLIHVYSVGYMHEDEGFARYFTYLNLFIFMMLTLVTANNLLFMFVGWEGVGLCSYLLIGFWYKKDSAANAGKKAFIVNRIGDYGFLLGIFLLLATLGSHGVWTLNFGELQKNAHLVSGAAATLITLLFFVGATGKSAQIPLYVWLPDAMEGPTPVSSLIHAATMVTAGVYMIARLNFLYAMAPTTMFVVTLVGMLTALLAATIGCAQYDIKRVLAYSTISQLGYMFVGVGAGAFAAGIFHLMTHAFFKGLLFLAAGSVMHAMSGELDMRKMGGLRRRTPVTYWTFLAGCIAIAGVPGFSGFFSKDEIMWKVFANYGGSFAFWAIGAATAGLTAFYMFRMFFRTFHGECRAPVEVKRHIHESPPVMTIPLVILAVLSVVGGWVGVPRILGGANRFEQWLEPVFGPGKEAAAPAINLVPGAFAESGAASSAGLPASPEGMLMAAAVIIAFAGIFIAYYFYVKRPEIPLNFVRAFPGVFGTVNQKYYVDEIYQAVFVRGLFALGRFLKRVIDETLIDGAVNGIALLLGGVGSLVRLIQTGYVQGYAFAMIIGAIAVLGYLIMKVIL